MILIATLILIANSYKLECDLKQRIWSRQPRLYMNEKQVLTPTAHSFSLIVDSTDQVVSKSILETGTWQPQLLPVLNTFINEGSTVLNLGSHVGMQAIIMGKLAGPQGRVFIFQPFSTSYKMVFKNIEINDLMGITTIYKMGAGKEKQTLKLWIDPDNTGHSSFSPDNTANLQTYEEIEIDQVDQIIGEVRVDFALIDVEMFQVQALYGMKEILKKSPSFIALIEWRYLANTNRDERATKDILKWLQEQNFFWYRYHPSHNPCEFGTMEMIDSQQLLTIKQQDLLLIGGWVDLSKLLSK